MRSFSRNRINLVALNSVSENVAETVDGRAVSSIKAEGTSTNEPFFTFAKSLPLHIYVDAEIRSHLNMANSERKARICLPREIDETLSVQSLREIIENKFPRLTNQPYVLRFQVPGAVTAPRKVPDINYGQHLQNLRLSIIVMHVHFSAVENVVSLAVFYCESYDTMHTVRFSVSCAPS